MRRAALLLLSTVVLFACVVLIGRSGGAMSAQAAVRRSAAGAANAGSFRFTLRLNGRDLPEALTAPSVIEGVVDNVHHRGRISYPGQFELVFDGEASYRKWALPWSDGTRWMRYDERPDADDPLDMQARALSNPLGLLAFLEDGSNDVHSLGSEVVAGTATIHYEGTLDLQTVVDRAPLDKRPELRDELTLIGEDEPTLVPFALWADDDGVPRRLRIEGAEGMSTTIDYFDFGIPVEVTLPSTKDVITAEEFMQEVLEHSPDFGCDGAAPPPVPPTPPTPPSDGGDTSTETFHPTSGGARLTIRVCEIGVSE